MMDDADRIYQETRVFGAQFDRAEFDELSAGPRREVIVARADGSTYSAGFPEGVDLGQVLGDGEVVVHDGGS